MLINIRRTEKELETLAKYLKGDISLENGIYSLNLNKETGVGQVRCICFNKFMTSMEIDVTLRVDTLVSLGTKDTDMLYFMYTLEGDCNHKFNDHFGYLDLEPLQTVVIASNEGTVSQLLIKKGHRLHFNLIRIDRTRYLEKFIGDFHGLDSKLKELLDIFDIKDRRYHLGRHNLHIGEHIKALEKSTRNNDLSSLLQFEGISNLILADQIEQFFKEINNGCSTTTLSHRELQIIEDLSDFISNYPEIQHSVRSLCDKGGISSAKLQEGFKLKHQLTVSNYIRNVRLKKAEYLIRTSDLNISEVVYSIGLTSRSYFCKIFKQKYDCSPKEYRKKANVVTL